MGATVIYPQHQGELQLTLEPSYVHRRDGGEQADVTFDAEIGLTRWLQLEVEWNAPVIRGGDGRPTEAGIGGLELGTQLTWMRMRGSPFSAAVAFEATVPVGRRPEGFGEGSPTYEPFMTFAVDASRGRAQLFTNVGAELSTEERNPFASFGVIGAAGITRPHLVVSIAAAQAYLVPGVSLRLPREWELIAGVTVGLTRDADPIGVGLMVVHEINLLERRSH